MNTRMLKAILVGMLLIVGTGGDLFAGGALETNNVDERQQSRQHDIVDENGDVLLSFQSNLIGAFGALQVVIVNDGTDYAIIRVNESVYSDYKADGLYAEPFIPIFDGVDLTGSTSAEVSDFSELEDVKYRKGEMTLDENTMPYLDLVKIKDTASSSRYGKDIVLSEKSYGVQKGYEVLFLKKTPVAATFEYTYLAFSMTPEFFPGEKELFENGGPIPGESYREKAVNFLAAYLYKQGANEFTIGTEPNSVSLYNVYKTLVSEHIGIDVTLPLVIDDSITKYFPSFRRVVSSQFRYRSEERRNGDNEYLLPYLDYTENTFEKIYGIRENRNPYIAAYMLLLFANESEGGEEVSKPILSSIITDICDDDSYDFRQYRSITESEGEQLARNTLRYLTWGVEYSSFDGWDGVDTAVTGRKVFSVIEGAPWLEAGSDSDKRGNNYLPGEPYDLSDVESPDSPVEYPNGEIAYPRTFSGYSTENRVNIFGKYESGKTLELARIDIWTSTNIAWEEGLLNPAVWNVEYATDENDEETIAPGPRSISTVDRIRNGVIRRDPEDSRNTLITREGDFEIGVGYTFTRSQQIGGVCLVRGRVDNSDKFYESDDYTDETSNNKTLVDILIRRNNIWEKLPLTNAEGQYLYYEIAVDPNDKSFVKYPHLYGRTPGYSMWSSYFAGNEDNKNGHVSYTYFIFSKEAQANQLRDIEGLMIVDKTKHSFLNVAEMMVFPEDPLMYLSERGDSEEDVGDANSDIPVTVSAGNTDVSALLTHGNFAAPVSVTFPEYSNDTGIHKGVISINLPWRVPIKSVILWEPNAEVIETQELAVFFGNANLYSSEFFNTVNLTDTDEWRLLRNSLDTPFAGEGSKLLGNPLPYTSNGIDSPRTFNCKMQQQYNAKKWMNGLNEENPRISSEKTTQAITEDNTESYKHGYVSEIDLLRTLGNLTNVGIDSRDFTYDRGYFTSMTDIPEYNDNPVKPFLPGCYLASGKEVTPGENSPYHPDKSAGVDATGLLLGSIAMTDYYSGILNIFNEKIVENLDAYYAMDSQAPGLDTSHTPAYYTFDDNVKSYLEGSYRFTRSDIERSTILVPDISFIQKGDILVRYDVKGEAHIGIVAELDWGENRPGYGDDAKDYWNRVYVVSVRSGFRQVTLGTWGNASNTFGGFTTEPEAYQIRRLLVKDNNTCNAEKPSWELSDRMYPRSYTGYVDVGPNTTVIDKVPWSFEGLRSSLALAQELGTADETATENELHADDYEYSRAYQMAYPYEAGTLGTQRKYFRELPPTSFVNRDAEHSLFMTNSMVVTCLSGWREMDDATNGGRTISYHRGMDISTSGGSLGLSILAPEDGVFWFVEHDRKKQIKISDEIKLRIDEYLSEGVFGVITVLVTNPEHPEEGRIYLFAHQNRGVVTDEFPASYDGAAPFSDGSDGSLGMESGVKVKAGDWVGVVGREGLGTGPHIHMEVYEYFEDLDITRLKRDDGVTNFEPKPNHRWQRVDPGTVFPKEWLTMQPDADETQEILDNVEDDSDFARPLFSNEGRRRSFLQEWTRFSVSRWR